MVDLVINLVQDLTVDLVVGGSGNSPFVPSEDISLVGSYIFDDDTVALFDDDSQILKD